MKLLRKLCAVLLTLISGCYASEEQALSSQTDSTAKFIKETTGAEECYISYSDHNSLGDSMSVILIEIINPKAFVERMPLWQSTSLAALEYLEKVGASAFLEYEGVEVQITRDWDGTLIDSTASTIHGCSTKDVIESDSLFKILLPILQNTTGSGFNGNRKRFDPTIPDSVLEEMDNARLKAEVTYGRAQTPTFGGFEVIYRNDGDIGISIHMLESRSQLTLEHIVTFSRRQGLILAWSSKTYPGQ
jgi:hypothetical protein